MPRSFASAMRRAANLKCRIATRADDYLPCCTVPDPITGKACGRPTARAAKQGLSAFTCKRCQQFKARHGSFWCRTPSAAMLKPYLRAASTVIKRYNGDPFICAAIAGLAGIMASAGPAEIATRLKGMHPDQKARQALARLQQAGVPPERILRICLAIHALFEDAPHLIHRTTEFRRVSIAKSVHRIRNASGTHRTWPVVQPDGRVKHIVMHAFPNSSGRILRHLGKLLETEAELVIGHFSAEVLDLKAARDRLVTTTLGNA